MQQFETEKLVGNQYRMLNKIGRGSFGEVMRGQNIETNEWVAIKLENADAMMPQLKHEYQLLSNIQGNGIPKVYWFGDWEDKTVMVMEILGYNLEELFGLVNRRFSLKTQLMLIDQMIDIISLIHARGYLYRDIKPENLLMGINKRFDTIYLIDFGLSKRYKDKKSGEHIPYKENKGLVGTARYVSLNTHLGIGTDYYQLQEQSRRDDLESLGYLWLYCLKGSLPWQGLDVTTREEKYELIKTIKQSIQFEDLCQGLPSEFVTYFQHCRSLRFDEEPDYKRMKMMFRDLFFKLDFVWDFQFDWEDVCSQGQQLDKLIISSKYSKNSISSAKGGSQIIKTDEEELDVQEKIEFKIGNAQSPKVQFSLAQFKGSTNLFESIFK